jgi:hypothetical protein
MARGRGSRETALRISREDIEKRARKRRNPTPPGTKPSLNHHTGYHIALSKDRESISKYGLHPLRPGDAESAGEQFGNAAGQAVYLWADQIPYSQWDKHNNHDIWAVQLNDREYFIDPSDLGDHGAIYHPGHIPADQLRLIGPAGNSHGVDWKPEDMRQRWLLNLLEPNLNRPAVEIAGLTLGQVRAWEYDAGEDEEGMQTTIGWVGLDESRQGEVYTIHGWETLGGYIRRMFDDDADQPELRGPLWRDRLQYHWEDGAEVIASNEWIGWHKPIEIKDQYELARAAREFLQSGGQATF